MRLGSCMPLASNRAAHSVLEQFRVQQATDEIPLHRPWLTKGDYSALEETFETGWIMQGPKVESFEREFAKCVGAKHACAVSNGTVALQLALQALGVASEDLVATVSHSFIATANSIVHTGAVPCFVDIDLETMNLSVSSLERALQRGVKAVTVPHQLGMPANLPAILALTEKHQVPVIEDAACALGSHILWKGAWESIGKPHGALACFSFHPRKIITTGEGGMITTNDSLLDARVRSLRNHGLEKGQNGEPTYSTVGYNYRMTDIQASLGLSQLDRLPLMLERRSQQVELYRELLGSYPVKFQIEASWARSNWQSFAIRCDSKKTKTIRRRLQHRGIATRSGLTNAHGQVCYEQTPWRCTLSLCSCSPRTCAGLRNSEAATEEWLILPVFHELPDAAIRRICEAIKESLN